MKNAPGQPSPLFLKSFEMVVWLLEHTKKSPKHQRFVLAKRMEEAALSLQDQIPWATKTGRKMPALLEADYHLERLRLYNRLAVRMHLQSSGQFEHLARMLEELGRLLGGWMDEVREEAQPGAQGARASS